PGVGLAGGSVGFGSLATASHLATLLRRLVATGRRERNEPRVAREDLADGGDEAHAHLRRQRLREERMDEGAPLALERDDERPVAHLCALPCRARELEHARELLVVSADGFVHP